MTILFFSDANRVARSKSYKSEFFEYHFGKISENSYLTFKYVHHLFLMEICFVLSAFCAKLVTDIVFSSSMSLIFIFEPSYSSFMAEFC